MPCSKVASVEPEDVTFPLAPNGEANRVRVEVFRTAERSNPLSTFIMSVFGMSTADISARATAHAARANAITCVRPFTIPDRWTENNIHSNDTFDRYDNFGNEDSQRGRVHPGGKQLRHVRRGQRDAPRSSRRHR